MAAKRKAKKKRTSAVQYQKVKDETLSEVRSSSIEMLKLRRVKYVDNEYDFIDIRLYRRGFDDNENEVYYPTRIGVQMKETSFLKLLEGYYK